MSDEKSLRFDTGRLSLNLMTTLGNQASSSPIERLSDGESLAEWLNASGLTRRDVDIASSDLLEFRELRETLFVVVRAAMGHRAIRQDHAATLNRLAQGNVPVPRLIVDLPGQAHREQDLDLQAVRSLVARDAIDLVTGDDLAMLRECEANDCTAIYVDNSRGRRRRWCSTARCGNRARVAAHRARRRSSSVGEHDR